MKELSNSKLKQVDCTNAWGDILAHKDAKEQV